MVLQPGNASICLVFALSTKLSLTIIPRTGTSRHFKPDLRWTVIRPSTKRAAPESVRRIASRHREQVLYQSQRYFAAALVKPMNSVRDRGSCYSAIEVFLPARSEVR